MSSFGGKELTEWSLSTLSTFPLATVGIAGTRTGMEAERLLQKLPQSAWLEAIDWRWSSGARRREVARYSKGMGGIA